MEAVSLVCQLFGALVLAVNAAPYFWWGDAGQHVEVWRGQTRYDDCQKAVQNSRFVWAKT